MKYQLVLQFPETIYGDLDWIAAFEDYLEGCLDKDAELDGHDIGSGEVNVFIHTNNAINTFEHLKIILVENGYLDNMKVAYRGLKDDYYICLWPEDLLEFHVV